MNLITIIKRMNYSILWICIILLIFLIALYYCFKRNHQEQQIHIPHSNLENILQHSLITYNQEINNSLQRFGEISSNQSNFYENNMECSICMELIPSYEKVFNLPCNHVFHKNCILDAAKINLICPTCRLNLKQT